MNLLSKSQHKVFYRSLAGHTQFISKFSLLWIYFNTISQYLEGFACCFKTESLCRPDWSQMHSIPLASIFQVSVFQDWPMPGEVYFNIRLCVLGVEKVSQVSREHDTETLWGSSGKRWSWLSSLHSVYDGRLPFLSRVLKVSPDLGDSRSCKRITQPSGQIIGHTLLWKWL